MTAAAARRKILRASHIQRGTFFFGDSASPTGTGEAGDGAETVASVSAAVGISLYSVSNHISPFYIELYLYTIIVKLINQVNLIIYYAVRIILLY